MERRTEMNTKLLKTLSGALLAGVIVSGQAFADYNGLIEKLEAKGTLTAEEAKDLKVKNPIATSDKNDAVSIKLTGRMQFQGAYVDQENDVNSGDWSTFEVRRARVGASAKFPFDISAKVEANVKPSDASVSSATIHWTKHDMFNLNAGFDKPMSSLEENTSSASILTVERSNVNNIIAAPGETTGVWISGEAAPFFYHVGLYNDEGVDDARNSSNTEAEYLFNAHGGLTLELSENSELTGMISYMQSDDPNGNVGGDFEDVTVASLHFETGAFDLRTEYFMGTEADADTTGFYVMPSMKLSKKLEAVARYEYVESDDASGVRASSRYGRRTDTVVIGEDEEGEMIVADKGDEYSALYLGMNYYFQKYSKVMFGIEFSELSNTKAGNLDTTTVFSAWRVRF
jgi:hypothetical protein